VGEETIHRLGRENKNKISRRYVILRRVLSVPASLLVVVVRPLGHPSTRANNALQHARRVRIATSALERLASIHEFHPNLCNAPDDGRW